MRKGSGILESCSYKKCTEFLHGEHTVVQNIHRGTLTPSVHFRAKVMRRAHDHVDHKLMKAIEVAKANPALNIDRVDGNSFQLSGTG